VFRGLPLDGRLREYAKYTKEQAELLLEKGQYLEEVKGRLYQNAFRFGKKLRKNLCINTWEEAVEALAMLYRHIGIDFRFDGRFTDASRLDCKGKITVRSCFFSSYYTGGICRIISSLDEGLAAGLSDGGRLCFQHRITEGESCCIGSLVRLYK